MEQEQLEKQIDWLEKERRADKQIIDSLKTRLSELENHIQKTNTYAQSLDGEITKLNVRLTRIDAFDKALSVVRSDVKKELDAQEKRVKSREKYAKSKYENEFSNLKIRLEELREKLTVIPGMQNSIEANKLEDLRQDKIFDALEVGIRENKNAHQELVQKVQKEEKEENEQCTMVCHGTNNSRKK